MSDTAVATVPVAINATIEEQLVLWGEHDKRFFPEQYELNRRIVGDYRRLRLPEAPEEFSWVIVDGVDITSNLLVARMRREKIGVYTYADDLDSVRSDRIAVSAPYLTRIRNRIEADEELQNRSAEDLAREQITCITLPQDLRADFFYWAQTGSHLDVVNVTLCAGSRFSVGGVPGVDWDGGRVGVGWRGPRGADPRLRARAAVS